jgi:hypothetical protein
VRDDKTVANAKMAGYVIIGWAVVYTIWSVSQVSTILDNTINMMLASGDLEPEQIEQGREEANALLFPVAVGVGIVTIGVSSIARFWLGYGSVLVALRCLGGLATTASQLDQYKKVGLGTLGSIEIAFFVGGLGLAIWGAVAGLKARKILAAQKAAAFNDYDDDDDYDDAPEPVDDDDFEEYEPAPAKRARTASARRDPRASSRGGSRGGSSPGGSSRRRPR